jgi:hypothetical protein
MVVPVGLTHGCTGYLQKMHLRAVAAVSTRDGGSFVCTVSENGICE